jgi:hypothetical protein
LALPSLQHFDTPILQELPGQIKELERFEETETEGLEAHE